MNLTKRCRGELTKAYGMNIFVGGTSNLQMREGESFYTCHPKTSHWELASKTRISDFGTGTSEI
jgi:hypothetical protein